MWLWITTFFLLGRMRGSMNVFRCHDNSQQDVGLKLYIIKGRDTPIGLNAVLVKPGLWPRARGHHGRTGSPSVLCDLDTCVPRRVRPRLLAHGQPLFHHMSNGRSSMTGRHLSGGSPPDFSEQPIRSTRMATCTVRAPSAFR